MVKYFTWKLLETAKLTPAPAGGKTLQPTATPSEEESPTPTPDTSWIEPYVESIANQWLAKGYYGIDVAVFADDLRQCLLSAAQSGAGQEQAKTLCPPEGFEPSETMVPTPEPEPGETPTPTPEPTPAPTPVPGVQMTAAGKYNHNPIEGWTDTENSLVISWNTDGGPITSPVSRHSHNRPAANGCGTESYTSVRRYSGEYFPGSGTFYGTYTNEWQSLSWREDPQTGCYEFPLGGTNTGVTWEATLSGSTVTGDGVLGFTLTVQ